jgi:integral membrane protein
MNLKTSLGQLRILAIMEGISYLLFALTMPLKYIYEIGMPNKIVGMAHGVLFIAYVLWVYIVGKDQKWSWQKLGIAWIASLLPFATFWVDAKYLKPSTETK